MKYIEVSKKFKLGKNATPSDLKKALLENLKRSCKIKNIEDNKGGFIALAETKGQMSIVGHAEMGVNVHIKKDKDVVRITAFGRSRMAGSLLAMYIIMFVFVLMIGLMPGSFETSGEASGPGDVLVFIFVGIFIYFDLEKKISQPKEYLEFALDSLETEFG